MVNGKWHGPLTEYRYKNGQDEHIIERTGEKCCGLDHGEWNIVGDNGARNVVMFKNGKKHGKCLLYSKAGKLKAELLYENNFLLSTYKYDHEIKRNGKCYGQLPSM